MSNSIRAVVATIGILALTAASAEVYRSTDEAGNTVYTDTPGSSEAKELKLPPMNVVPAPSATGLNLDVKQPDFDLEKYQSLEIVAPQNDATVFIRTANLPIEVKLLPPVKQGLGHRLLVLWDGQVLFENETSYVLDDANPGAHTILAQVVDEKGKVIIKSKPVTVYIRKPTVLNNH